MSDQATKPKTLLWVHTKIGGVMTWLDQVTLFFDEKTKAEYILVPGGTPFELQPGQGAEIINRMKDNANVFLRLKGEPPADVVRMPEQ